MGFNFLGDGLQTQMGRRFGSQDPIILGEILSAKTWWSWIQGGLELWKRLWNKKYSMSIPQHGLIRMEEVLMGSILSNSAW